MRRRSSTRRAAVTAAAIAIMKDERTNQQTAVQLQRQHQANESHLVQRRAPRFIRNRSLQAHDFTAPNALVGGEDDAQ